MYFELPDKKYFSISEVSKLFNVNNSLLRFWEKEFEILKPKVKPSGVRKFTKEDIEKVSSISVSYTQSPSPRDRTRSRMPSSA